MTIAFELQGEQFIRATQQSPLAYFAKYDRNRLWP